MARKVGGFWVAFLDTAAFDAVGMALTGATQPRPCWQARIAELNGVLGEAAGRLYAERHFPQACEARRQQLVAKLLASYKTSIDGLTWMTAPAQAQAQATLAKVGTKIDFLDTWRKKVRDERAAQLLKIDPHSPPAFRASGAAVDNDGFHEAFDTKPGDRMHWAAGERVRIR